MRIDPETPPLLPLLPPPPVVSPPSLPQAAMPTARTDEEAMTAIHLELVTETPLWSCIPFAGPGAASVATLSSAEPELVTPLYRRCKKDVKTQENLCALRGARPGAISRRARSGSRCPYACGSAAIRESLGRASREGG